MAKKILGLDICHQGVCAVLISSGLKGERLEDHAYIPLDAEMSSEELEEAMVTALGKMDTAGALWITSLPANSVSFRNVTLPFGDVKKVRQILPFEMEPLIPYPIDAVITECASVRTGKEANQGNDVLAVAVPVSELQSHIDRVAAAQVEPDAITVSGFPTAQSLIEITEDSEAWLMADLDDHSTTLFIVRDGAIRNVRTVAAGMGNPKILAREMLRTLTAYIDMDRHPISPDMLFLTGSGVVENGIDRMLESTLKIPVQRVQMIRECGISVDQPLPRAVPLENFNDAVSMALLESRRRSMPNLRQGAFTKKTPWAEYRKNILVSSALATLVLLLGFAGLILGTYQIEKQVDAQAARIQSIFQQTFPKRPNIVYPAEQLAYFENRLTLAKKTTIHQSGIASGRRAVDILLEISRRIPAELNVEFSRLVMSSDSLLISGETDTFNTVDTIKSGLEGVDTFQSVTITSANVQKSGNRISFKLKVQL